MNVVNAATIRGEFGDMKRFPSGKEAASYAGIVPPNYQSGEKETHGHVTNKGSPYLRHALVETVHQTRRYPSQLRDWFVRLEAKIGTRKALVATGRKLAHVVWAMTTKETNYKDEDPSLTDLKTWRHDRINELVETGERDEAKRLLRSHHARQDMARHRRAAQARDS
jgi:hypothetical protein